jgi:hypothetical protein
MSGTTPRVGFYLPADDGSEPINVATDLNDNLEKIDASMGFVPALESTPPATPFNGMGRYNTDTGKASFYKSGVWTQLLAAGAAFVGDILMDTAKKIGIGTLVPNSVIDVVVATIAGQPTLLRFRQAADTQSRMQLDHDGIKFGPGNALPEVHLYRPTTAQLALAGAGLSLGSTLDVTGATSVNDLDVAGDINLGGDVVTDLNVVGDISGTGKGYTQVIRKTTDATRTSTTTTTTDPDMIVALAANTNYLIEFYMMISGTAGDFKLAWNAPAGSTVYRWSLGPDVGATSNSNVTMRTSIHVPASEPAFGVFSDTSWSGAKETIIVLNGATAGNLQLKWAQNTSNAAVTTLRANSFMLVRKID